MSENRRKRKLIEDKLGVQFVDVVNYLRHEVKHRSAPMAKVYVDYIKGKDLIDALLNSNWGVNVNSVDPVFTSRSDCVAFLDSLVEKEMVSAVEKVFKVGSEKKKRFYLKECCEETQSSVVENSLFVWIYDPPTTRHYFLGLAVLAVVIACCLFPLWPSKVRSLAFYGSVGVGGFFGLILALAVFKYLLFVLIWICTGGEIHFWLFPNLTEDVGFFESFVPVYEFSRYSESQRKKREKKKPKQEVTRQEIEQTITQEYDVIEEKDIEQNGFHEK